VNEEIMKMYEIAKERETYGENDLICILAGSYIIYKSCYGVMIKIVYSDDLTFA